MPMSLTFSTATSSPFNQRDNSREEWDCEHCDHSSDSTPIIIFVLGGPGAGKGTQCDLLSQRLSGVFHLSAGDLLREERMREESPFKELIETHIREGLIVPYEITIALLKQAMEKRMNTKDDNVVIKAFLIDGFPRNIKQGEEFERLIYPCKAMIFYECPDEELVHRILKRGETSGRIDDNREAIEKRLKTFRESTMAVFNHYEKKGKLKRISAIGSIDQVFSESRKFIEALLG
jgi:UMP-CMP kinase